ncbi:MAG TPA: methionine biosynthesis protein MetW [Candidatus Saccharimonadaceae bacterium]|jgi:methionine biosynthesis protein MetW|nr:methionine biosynthesis protein MetW [Candidatus Saccharimonadaceae bacterium]
MTLPPLEWRADYGYAQRGGAVVDRPEYATLLGWTPRGSRVLDVGCGDGSLGARLIGERGCTVTGLDLDPTGVEIARGRGLDARVHDVDAGLPFADRSHDVAIMNVTLHMVYRPGFTLGEVLRVAPVALVTFPNVAHWTARLQLLAGRFPRRPLYGRHWYDTRHIHLFSWADFGDLVGELGARVTASRHLGFDSRTPSRLAQAWPNLFAAICMARVERGAK